MPHLPRPGFLLRIGRIAVALSLLALPGGALAATQYVNALGASTGWWSDDTRDAGGFWLNGKVQTIPGYLGPLTPVGTPKGDKAIAEQIAIGDFYAGSDAGDGVIRLWATDENPGKASIGTFSYYGGFASIASLLDGFTASFRVYVEPAPTPRTPAFRLSFLTAAAQVGSFVHFHTPLASDDWTTVDLDENSVWAVNLSSSGWLDDSISNPRTMAQWQEIHPEFFAPSGFVFALGFNLGSGQRQCYAGIDWLETSLLNDGDRIEFGTYGWSLDYAFVQDKSKPDTDLWSVKGDLAVEDAPGFLADVTANGLTVAIDDSSASGAFAGDEVSFDAADCNETSATNGIRCKDADGSLARLIPRPGHPNEYRANIRIRRREFAAPALGDTPLQVTISTSTALEAVARAVDCSSLLSGSKIYCRN